MSPMAASYLPIKAVGCSPLPYGVPPLPMGAGTVPDIMSPNGGNSGPMGGSAGHLTPTGAESHGAAIHTATVIAVPASPQASYDVPPWQWNCNAMQGAGLCAGLGTPMGSGEGPTQPVYGMEGGSGTFDAPDWAFHQVWERDQAYHQAFEPCRP